MIDKQFHIFKIRFPVDPADTLASVTQIPAEIDCLQGFSDLPLKEI